MNEVMCGFLALKPHMRALPSHALLPVVGDPLIAVAGLTGNPWFLFPLLVTAAKGLQQRD